MNDYIPRKARILDFFRETPDIIYLRTDFRCRHEPGQFVMTGIPGIGEAPISLSSYSDKYTELHIREVGNVTNALGKLKKGSRIFMRGPYGKGYPMQELQEKNIVMIGGGCGAAPLKSVIEYLEKNRKNYGSVDLFFGYASPGEILFRKKISEWKKRFNLYLSVDKNPENKFCYNARKGFVTELLKKEKPVTKTTAVMICGPVVMMSAATEILRKRGFKEDQIYLSTERLMDCGLGICGHCMIHGKYTCLDGPVFRYDEISGFGD
jgi:anaerobic sulfite reductase subunit B